MMLVLVLMMLVLVMKLAMLLITPANSDAVVDDGVDDGDGVVKFCFASVARLNLFLMVLMMLVLVLMMLLLVMKLVLVLMMLALVIKLAMLLMTPAGFDAVVDDGVEDGDGVVRCCTGDARWCLVAVLL